MLTGEGVMEIRILRKQGKSIRAIALSLGISRATVRKYLRVPDTDPSYGPRAVRVSKLDPFKDYLRQRIKEACPRRLPATVYNLEIRALGYEGSLTILRDWLRGEYPQVPAPAVVRFETESGKQAQVDWTKIRRGKDPLSAFVGVLGFSRFTYVRFVDNEQFEAMIEGHERFFDLIGGVPQTILYDNMKTVVLDRDAYGRGQHRFHGGFREFAKHHGFIPRMCAPYRAQTKGKVERFNHYLKNSFVWPLESRLNARGLILDAATANAHVGKWLRTVANPRVHAETKERPVDRLAQESGHLFPRGPFWKGIAPCAPADLGAVHVPQHDLSIYDAIGRVA